MLFLHSHCCHRLPASLTLSLVDLQVLAKYAKILPVVKNQHLLLCTLLICNAAAMEALPIFLDALITAWGAILISVTLILLFGEVKNLLTVHPEDQVPVKNVTIRRVPRVPETMPLYDILNKFQKGHSHMAVVVRQCTRISDQPTSIGALENSVKDVKIDIDGEKPSSVKSVKTKRPLQKWKSFPNNGKNSFNGTPRSKKWTKNMYSDILQIDGSPLPKLPEEEEAVGIITMEDVIEELLQEEIFDETDHHAEDS